MKQKLNVRYSIKINLSKIIKFIVSGFHENMPRCLSEGCGIEINKNSWNIPPIFKFLQDLGKIDESEMYHVFNMGIGMILVVDSDDAKEVLDILKANDQDAHIIGEVVAGKGVSFR